MTLLIGLLCFIASIAVHLIICRQSKVKDLKAKAFVQLAMGGLLIFSAAVLMLDLPLLLITAFIYVLSIPIYLTFYVSTELVSPSKRVLQFVKTNPGADYEQIYVALEREHFIMTRLIELQQSGCVIKKGDHFYLTTSGKSIAGFLNTYQVLSGRETGG